MQKVIVASKNPVKINAVRIGFEKMFPGQVFEYSGVSVPSHVSDQPMSDEETLRGAQNRVANAAQLIADADFVVGIEGGVTYIDDEMSAFAWIVVQSKKIQGKAKSATFFLPLQVSSLIKEGKGRVYLEVHHFNREGCVILRNCNKDSFGVKYPRHFRGVLLSLSSRA